MIPAAMTTEALTALLGAMTPGPWESFAWGKHSGATAKEADVAHCHGHHSLRPRSEEHANACAIALTPTLIAELLTARSQIEALTTQRDTAHNAMQTLADAVGTAKRQRDAALARVRVLEGVVGELASRDTLGGSDGELDWLITDARATLNQEAEG